MIQPPLIHGKTPAKIPENDKERKEVDEASHTAPSNSKTFKIHHKSVTTGETLFKQAVDRRLRKTRTLSSQQGI